MNDQKEKKVVEEVACWLKLFDDGSVDRTWSGPPEAEFMAKPVLPHEEFIDGVSVHDVTIDTKSGLGARLYIPERNPYDEEKLPIFVHFHGGGFCISEPELFMYYHMYTRLVRSARAVCVSVKLRLAPEHRLPAACEDGHSVLLWLQAVALAKLNESWLKANGDFGRVFLIGDSSGGNLVHTVAGRAGFDDLKPIQLAGGILIHPGFVRAERSKSELEKKSDSPFLTLEMVDKFLALALPIGSTKDHPITYPMGPAAPPLAGLKLPPFLVVLAENDLILDTEMEYCEAMKKAGKDVEVLVNPGVGHSFYLNKIAVDIDAHTASETKRLITEITNFIKRH
ncbi:probable carboxylesterase 17 [Macadamia integrifolia]|uniref:probable carboxylesterase 17 n=1 Tax=Macadamia integrifolia TaxID=60698 RepID=UPI001C4E3DA5|nr:probable carboxylesterase 17 [Macadamia integrifolia]